MKRSIALTSILIAGCALNGSAASTILEEWNFDEVAGKRLDEAANTGDIATTYPWESLANFATDGAGNLDVLAGTGGYKGSNSFTALSGAQTYSLEITVGQWNIPAANTVRARLQWRMNANPNVVEIQTLLDPSNGLGFTLVSAGTNYRTHWVGGASGTVATARVDFNLADGTATYFVNGDEKETFTGQTFDPMTGFLMQKTDFNNAGVDAATVLKIDSQTLSVVPEPGTLSLLSFVGIGLLTARRRN